MSTEIENQADIPIEDPVVKLRDEMNAQFNELKVSFEASIKEKDDTIEKLREQNTGLQRALVRSAVMDPPKQEIPKTEQQLHNEEVERLSNLTLHYMSKR